MATVRPFRFATTLAAGDRASVIAFTERAESLGFDTIGLPDHLGPGLLAPIPTAMLVAEASERLRVALWVLNNGFRHPAVVAKDVATLTS